MKKSSPLLSFTAILSGAVLFFVFLFSSSDVPDPQTFFKEVLEPFETFGLTFSSSFLFLKEGLSSLLGFFQDPSLVDLVNIFQIFTFPFKAIYYVAKLLFDILEAIGSLV